MISHLKKNPWYKSWVNEQEAFLRKLINRNCTVLQFRYFLVFLLLGNQRYQRLKEECEEILLLYPNNVMARTVLESFCVGSKGQEGPSRNSPARRRNRVGICSRCGGHRGENPFPLQGENDP